MRPRVWGGAAPVASIALASLLPLVCIPVAHAYCRTTTIREPIPYDPVVAGCWSQGTPLAWTPGRIPYVLAANASRQLTVAQASKTADVAFSAWNQAACPGNTVPAVQAFDDGTVSAAAASSDCGLTTCDPTVHDGQHVIVFRDDFWPHNDPNNTLAITTVTFGAHSGQIFDADIEVNSAQHNLTIEEPPPAGSFDLRAILTHEAGHFLGLAHATSVQSVMYAQYQPGAIQLTADDVAGICSIYPPASPGCSCSSAPGGSDRTDRPWAPAVALGVVLLAMTRRSFERMRVMR